MASKIMKPVFDAEADAMFRNADELARAKGHNYLGVEHIFLALCKMESSISVRKIIDELIPDLHRYIDALEEATNRFPGWKTIPKQLFVTPRLQKLKRHARDLALKSRRKRIRPLDLLEVIIVEGESLPAWILQVHLFSKQADPMRLDAARLTSIMALHRLKHRTTLYPLRSRQKLFEKAS